ncbi:hypothetical protein FLA105534_00001 [Flavobacterium bizetiae]|nr:hypothetical protein FLA105534_00001 [Flavobacterium bizetiae]
MLPPPNTILHVPPAGVADKVLVSVEQIAAVEVVLFAVPANGFTVKVTSELVEAQLPLAATVYLIVTLVSAVTASGV